MIQAILFNPEGKLVNVDTTDFMRNYLGILAPRFAHLLSPDKFAKQLVKSLETSQNNNNPEQTNKQTLGDDFSKAIGQSLNVMCPIFEKFYESDFSTLRCLVQPTPQGVKVVEYAIQQGFLTAVATNPILPLSAMQEYVLWAGFKPEQFNVIPALEDFHYFKPQPGFFQEIAQKLGVEPDNCLMVSGQTQDLICQDIGMKVFMIGQEANEPADYTGNLDDLFRLIGQGKL